MQPVFKKAKWINTTNIYEVNLRQYTIEGTFNAFVKELPRLKDMGVETLWFMPLTPIAAKNRKGSLGSYYACSSYTSINPEFGTEADFIEMVKLAHSMNFKVIIDWVANHTGWDHEWTKQYPDFYLKDSQTNDFKMAEGMTDIIELDFDNIFLRQKMIEAMIYWVQKFDIDGFRCDLAFWVPLDFWMEARFQLEKIKTLFWLGEMELLDYPLYFPAFDAAYTWTWMGEAAIFYKEYLSVELLKNLLYRYDHACANENIPVWFTSNHDENSWNGTEYEKYGDMAHLLAVFSCTWNGIPMLYSGQEMANKKRLQFFEKDVIEWNGTYALHSFYKSLLSLRKKNEVLCTNDKQVTTYLLTIKDEKNILGYLRKKNKKEILVFLNCSKEKKRFQITEGKIAGDYYDIFKDKNIRIRPNEFFETEPWGFLVYEK